MQPGVDFIGITTPFYCNDGKGNFVFHKRSKNCRDEQGKWDPGSGQLHIGETPQQSVLREVAEEYGVKGKIQEQLPAHSIFRTHNGRATHWLAVPFFVLINPKKVRLNEPKKMVEIDWFTLDKLPEPLHTGFHFTLTHYQDYFKKYKARR